jgi:AraC-like DNA-binding protein
MAHASSAVRKSNAKELPCYSVRLMQPFIELLAGHPAVPAQALAPLRKLDPDERIPVARVHELLAAALEVTGDPDLGLKAGRLMSPGHGGAVDYAMRSARTVADAIAIVTRYARLINDALDLQFEVEDDRAVLRLASRMLAPRAATDFMMSGFHAVHARTWLSDPSMLECWLPYRAPEDRAEHARTFAPARVRFDMPSCAFVFAARELQAQLPTADERFHAIIRKHVEWSFAELPPTQSLTARVRDLAAQELPYGDPTAAHLARRLSMSPRTLGRKLEDEGTTFSAVFDDMRRQLALRYVAGQRIQLSEVAFLLGFSDVTTFHRSFKRWTRQTPVEYRRATRRA